MNMISNSNNFHKFSVEILSQGESVSKVRFAKTIYFVHKSLIQEELLDVGYIKYIRMPLGPVPCGFMSLNTDFPDILTKKTSSNLSYNSVEYSIGKRTHSLFKEDNALKQIVKVVTDKLKRISTSELVEISHKDPSWDKNTNGTVYMINSDDLKQPVPTTPSTMRLKSDNQMIQENLVKGMIDDIVKTSTDLEFPANEGQN